MPGERLRELDVVAASTRELEVRGGLANLEHGGEIV